MTVRMAGALRHAMYSVSRWCLGGIVGHLPLVAVSISALWPWVPMGAQWGMTGITATVILIVFTMGNSSCMQELLSLVDIIKFRWRLALIRFCWNRAVGRNASLSKTLTATDVSGSPLRTPGTKDVPKLIRWSWKHRPCRIPCGVMVWANGSNVGIIAPAFTNESQVIRGSIRKCRSVVVSEDRDYPHLSRISFIFDDPFKGIVLPESLPSASESLSVVLGLDTNGDPVEQSLWLPTLVVGRKGSGKSRLVRRILQGLCESDQPFLVWVFDPKGGGQEFNWLRDSAHHYESDRRQWSSFLQSFYNAMAEQGARLSARGLSECPEDDPEFPFQVVIVDELVTALKLSTTDEKILVGGVKMTVHDALGDYLTQNRSAGSTMVACTQLVQKTVLGPIRGLFDFVVCMGVNDRETAHIATGDAKAYPAHQIPKGREFSGRAYVASEDGVVLMRCAFVDDSASARIAERMRYWTEFYRDRDRKGVAA